MREYLADLVRASPTPARGRNLVREYLQARILGSLQRAGGMIPLAFHGGTALRFLYGIPRYSEDLDFALEGNRSGYDFRACLSAIRSELAAEGYAIELRVNDRNVVHSAFVRFAGLLFELDLSPRRTEAFSVKIEVDTNPPAGAVLATTITRRHVLLHLQHHDRGSLLAGKLHALLSRPYTKGRDVFDLAWYLSDPDWPKPNLTMLGHALRQTGWTEPSPSDANWREMVRKRLQALAWDRVVADVRPFLEPAADLSLLTRENVMRLLEMRR